VSAEPLKLEKPRKPGGHDDECQLPKQFCPVGDGVSRFSARGWTMVLLRELSSPGSQVNELRRAPAAMSSGPLVQGLRELEEACVSGA